MTSNYLLNNNLSQANIVSCSIKSGPTRSIISALANSQIEGVSGKRTTARSFTQSLQGSSKGVSTYISALKNWATTTKDLRETPGSWIKWNMTKLVEEPRLNIIFDKGFLVTQFLRDLVCYVVDLSDVPKCGSFNPYGNEQMAEDMPIQRNSKKSNYIGFDTFWANEDKFLKDLGASQSFIFHARSLDSDVNNLDTFTLKEALELDVVARLKPHMKIENPSQTGKCVRACTLGQWKQWVKTSYLYDDDDLDTVWKSLMLNPQFHDKLGDYDDNKFKECLQNVMNSSEGDVLSFCDAVLKGWNHQIQKSPNKSQEMEVEKGKFHNYQEINSNFMFYLEKSGITTDAKVLNTWHKYPDLISQVKLVHSRDDAARLYKIMSLRMGSATRRSLVASEKEIIVDGVFGVPQETLSTFYYAFDSGKPCILKFNQSPTQAQEEFQFYQLAKSSGGDGCDCLVEVELVTFQQPALDKLHIHAPRNALKMQIYVHTLASIPHTDQLAASYAFHASRVFRALQAIHQSGYAHCDIKPNNIFMNAEGICFLGDYDAATKLGEKVKRTTESFVPQEYLALYQGESLQATTAFDFSMLAITCIYLVTNEIVRTIEAVKLWKNQNSLSPLIEVIGACLSVTEIDNQLEEGRKLLEESARRMKVQQEKADAFYKAGWNSPDSDPGSVTAFF